MKTNKRKSKPDTKKEEDEIKRQEQTPAEFDPLKHPHSEPAELNEQVPREHPHKYTTPDTLIENTTP